MRNYLEKVGAPAGIRTPDTLLKRHQVENPQTIDIPRLFEH
mgnify:CR=1 FL=1